MQVDISDRKSRTLRVIYDSYRGGGMGGTLLPGGVHFEFYFAV